MLISFIVFYFSTESIIGVVIGIVFIDVEIQGVHILNQTWVYSLLPDAETD